MPRVPLISRSAPLASPAAARSRTLRSSAGLRATLRAAGMLSSGTMSVAEESVASGGGGGRLAPRGLRSTSRA